MLRIIVSVVVAVQLYVKNSKKCLPFKATVCGEADFLSISSLLVF